MHWFSTRWDSCYDGFCLKLCCRQYYKFTNSVFYWCLYIVLHWFSFLCTLYLWSIHLYTPLMRTLCALQMFIIWRLSRHIINLAVLCFYSKTGFGPRTAKSQPNWIKDKNFHTPIVVRNTLVGQLKTAIGAWMVPGQTKMTMFFSVILVTHPTP